MGEGGHEGAAAFGDSIDKGESDEVGAGEPGGGFGSGEGAEIEEGAVGGWFAGAVADADEAGVDAGGEEGAVGIEDPGEVFAGIDGAEVEEDEFALGEVIEEVALGMVDEDVGGGGEEEDGFGAEFVFPGFEGGFGGEADGIDLAGEGEPLAALLLGVVGAMGPEGPGAGDFVGEEDLFDAAGFEAAHGLGKGGVDAAAGVVFGHIFPDDGGAVGGAEAAHGAGKDGAFDGVGVGPILNAFVAGGKDEGLDVAPEAFLEDGGVIGNAAPGGREFR